MIIETTFPTFAKAVLGSWVAVLTGFLLASRSPLFSDTESSILVNVFIRSRCCLKQIDFFLNGSTTLAERHQMCMKTLPAENQSSMHTYTSIKNRNHTLTHQHSHKWTQNTHPHTPTLTQMHTCSHMHIYTPTNTAKCIQLTWVALLALAERWKTWDLHRCPSSLVPDRTLWVKVHLAAGGQTLVGSDNGKYLHIILTLTVGNIYTLFDSDNGKYLHIILTLIMGNSYPLFWLWQWIISTHYLTLTMGNI